VRQHFLLRPTCYPALMSIIPKRLLLKGEGYAPAESASQREPRAPSIQRHVWHATSDDIRVTPFLFHLSSLSPSEILIIQHLLDPCSSLRDQLPFWSRPWGGRGLISARSTEFSTFTCTISHSTSTSPVHRNRHLCPRHMEAAACDTWAKFSKSVRKTLSLLGVVPPPPRSPTPILSHASLSYFGGNFDFSEIFRNRSNHIAYTTFANRQLHPAGRRTRPTGGMTK